jgi:hypothetical protein
VKKKESTEREYGSRVWFRKRITREKGRKDPVANYPLIASNGPKLMDEIQWLKTIHGTCSKQYLSPTPIH